MTERTVAVKRPTINAIAKEAGVSKAAVSYALNGMAGVSPETRDRILLVAERLGWRPNIAARSLSVARAHAVGLVLARPAQTLGVEPFYMRFISGLERQLAKVNTALLLQLVEDHDHWNQTVAGWWAERRIDGVIVTDVRIRDSRFATLQSLGVPAVIAGRPTSRLSAPAVWSDDAQAVTSVLDHLFDLGHMRIARVAGLNTLDHTRVRNAAFTRVMRSKLLEGDDILATDYSFEAGAEATRALLSRGHPPTAILYDNDLMAVAALGTAREMGVDVPGQLSIVAGDDSPLCLIGTPTVTALARDVFAYGAQTGLALLEAIDGTGTESVEVDPPVLQVRGSTGPAPKDPVNRR